MLCTSGLTGEVFRERDPQESTDVQRAWLYQKDASIAAYRKGKTNQRPEKDNETSLAIGDGDRAANFVLSDEPGFYRHKRTAITNIKNKVFTQK